ncbi:MAG TPA: M23 family metallopeptidase [Fibrobacter sp.]|nr:M23 family metallopeptidase [Fibrobacter sp.]
MKKIIYTIQVIPENSKKIKIFRISKATYHFFKILFFIFLLALAFFIYKIAAINSILINYPQLKALNNELLEKQRIYENDFKLLDSIYIMEAKIQVLLNTYFEDDSAKISALLEKNKFNYEHYHKTQVDFDGVYGWRSYEEKQKIEKIPNILPVVGIISKKYSVVNNHRGIDFAAQIGDPVFATASGKVIFSESKSELGLTIDIDHGNGYVSSYSHLKSIKSKKGSLVKKGDIIGFIGNTGKTSGPHLHYAIIKNGSFVNPELYFNY